MKLILVRHGQAEPYCDDDAGRRLTHVGKMQASQTADFLVNFTKNNPVDVVITSPYHRANQTASIILNELICAGQNPAFMTVKNITPDDNPAVGLDGIDHAVCHQFGTAIDDLTVVIVSHMPIIAHLAATLDGTSPVFFELAECRVFDTPVIAEGLATQIAQFTPIQT
ncbi:MULTISPECIES: SixA phosphatase family protein [unclassified Moraxella]|uniref:SixA phosphatase family protein n=1 Tax=unclassified Moraxella TaxID=2685852 RepID=UPI002B40DA23|nr:MULTISPECIES: histidine phosphatase family protein [unclassified Moraxella]